MTFGEFNKLLNTMTVLYLYNSRTDQGHKSYSKQIASNFSKMLQEFLESFPNLFGPGKVQVITQKTLNKLLMYQETYVKLCDMDSEHIRLSYLGSESLNVDRRLMIIEREIKQQGAHMVSLWDEDLAKAFGRIGLSCKNEIVNDLISRYHDLQLNRARTQADGCVDMNKKVYGTIDLSCDEIKLGKMDISNIGSLNNEPTRI